MKYYRFTLEPYKGIKTRYTCPYCNDRDKTFTRYIDIETGLYLAAHVGKCERINSCDAHYKPKQYFQDNPQVVNHDKPFPFLLLKRKKQETLPKPIAYIPFEIFRAGLKNYNENNFATYLYKLFGAEVRNQIILKYLIGTSKHWKGAVSFPQIDKEGNVRQIKIMDYDSLTGKRKKAEQESWKLNYKTGKYFKDIGYGDKIFFAGKKILNDNDANLCQCFFGEFLLRESNKPVAIVESEKTAIIASVYLPDFIWLATGGINGCKWSEKEVYSALKGRDVILFPDLKALEIWKEKSKGLSTVARSVSFSHLLEDKAQEHERNAGLDIADFLTRYHHKEFEKIRAYKRKAA